MLSVDCFVGDEKEKRVRLPQKLYFNILSITCTRVIDRMLK